MYLLTNVCVLSLVFLPALTRIKQNQLEDHHVRCKGDKH